MIAALDDVDALERALSALLDALTAARDLGVHHSVSGPAERASAAAAVGRILEGAVAALNVEVGGIPVLGPFDAHGRYAGAGPRPLFATAGVECGVLVRADVVVGGARHGVDVLAVLAGLSSALAKNDATALRDCIDALRSGIAQVAAGRADAAGIGLGLRAVSACNDDRDALIAAARTLDDAILATERSYRFAILHRL